MKEYIEREAVITELTKTTVFNSSSYSMGVVKGIELSRQRVSHVPTADVVEVVHAKWNDDGRCTNCGVHAPFYSMASTYYKSPYCFECGAKMDKEEA